MTKPDLAKGRKIKTWHERVKDAQRKHRKHEPKRVEEDEIKLSEKLSKLFDILDVNLKKVRHDCNIYLQNSRTSFCSPVGKHRHAVI